MPDRDRFSNSNVAFWPDAIDMRKLHIWYVFQAFVPFQFYS